MSEGGEIITQPIADSMSEGGELMDAPKVVESATIETVTQAQPVVKFQPEIVSTTTVRMAMTPENLSEGALAAPVSIEMSKDAAAFGVTIKDNLKLIEGIGPKIEEILHKNHILTYSQLASTLPARIKEILLAEGSRFAVHDPSTWPAQALLAANEEWDNLKSYQTYLNAGKKPD